MRLARVGLTAAVLVSLTFYAAARGGAAQTPAATTPDRAAALQTEADRLARESRTLLSELRKLEIERELQNERARRAAVAVADAEQALANATARLSSLEAQRQSQLPDLRARLVDLYKRGRSGNARLLLGATSLRDFARTTRAVASLAAVSQSRLDQYKRVLAAARDERASQERALSAVRTERAQIEQGQAAANSAVAARTALLSDIDRRRDLTARLAGELQLAARQLDEQIAAVATPSTGASVPPAAAAVEPSGATAARTPVRGGIEWPLSGRVVGEFGEPSARSGGTVRNGIEIEATLGTPAKAIHTGTVVFAGPLEGYGTLVILDHGRGYHSVYGYLAAASVAKGQTVEAGTEVGPVGSTPGGPSGLYFEFRVDGRSVDPVQWLRPR